MFSIYTDGSCSLNNINDPNQEGSGGWGFAAISEEEEIVHTNSGEDKNTTNNRMELTAVLKAMEWMQANHPRESYTIYTDSAYIANCFLQKWYKKWQQNGYKTANRQAVKNTDLWKKIIGMYHGNEDRIKFEKVAGHAHNDYNELADHLANLWRIKDEDISID